MSSGARSAALVLSPASIERPSSLKNGATSGAFLIGSVCGKFGFLIMATLGELCCRSRTSVEKCGSWGAPDVGRAGGGGGGGGGRGGGGGGGG